MNVVRKALGGIVVYSTTEYADSRGTLTEAYNQRKWQESLGYCPIEFVQCNLTTSRKHVIRGMHYQIGIPQGKLVTPVAGVIYDVAVDMRKWSKTFGEWFGALLEPGSGQTAMWIPVGFAHGYMTVSDESKVAYMLTAHRHPDMERCLKWDDPSVGIDWLDRADDAIVSERDLAGKPFRDATHFSMGGGARQLRHSKR